MNHKIQFIIVSGPFRTWHSIRRVGTWRHRIALFRLRALIVLASVLPVIARAVLSDRHTIWLTIHLFQEASRLVHKWVINILLNKISCHLRLPFVATNAECCLFQWSGIEIHKMMAYTCKYDFWKNNDIRFRAL